MKSLDNRGALKLSLGLILVLVNTLAILAGLGAIVYTRIIFKRPVITESGERERLAQSKKDETLSNQERGLIHFKPMTLNIANPASRSPSDTATGPTPEGKLHYATVGFSLEVKSTDQEAALDNAKDIFMDRLLQLFSKKTFEDITSVHGRFILRSEIVALANSLLKVPVVTNVYFSQLTVQ